MACVAACVGLVNIALLYRKISFIAKLTVSLWIGMLFTVGIVIVTGFNHFDPKVAFDFPPNAFNFTFGFFMGLGAAARIGIYDYLGYYDICYLGDEVKNPGRVIPRSVIFSLLGVALIYFLMNLSIIGIVSWRDFVPADKHPDAAFVASTLMERIYGARFAVLFTVMILWTTYASVFALLLGYSRIPYAAAQDGYFFKVFGKLHPKKGFPHVSLLAIGAIAIVSCWLSLQTVIDTLVTCRILIQFMGQIGAVALLRKRNPDQPRPYRIWFYPIPSLVALAGWMFVFVTSGRNTILFSMLALAAGMVAFGVWSYGANRWPFVPQRRD